MVALPVRTVTRPVELKGQTNGRLLLRSLTETAGQARGPNVLLIGPAARGWRAMCAAALAAGHVLKATSLSDSYRPYAVQEALFRARYSTTRLAGRPTKTWQGRTWWLRPGMATAAVPGTSNHGLALAVDIGEEKDGDAGTESIDAGTVRWLVKNAAAYGFSAELQSEPWHWRWYMGNTIPAAVLAYEAHATTSTPHGSAPPAPEGDEDDMDPQVQHDVVWILAGLAAGAEEITIPHRNGGVAERKIPNAMAQGIIALKASVAALVEKLDHLAEGGGSGDNLPVIAAIRAEGDQTREAVKALQQDEAEARERIGEAFGGP